MMGLTYYLRNKISSFTLPARLCILKCKNEMNPKQIGRLMAILFLFLFGLRKKSDITINFYFIKAS